MRLRYSDLKDQQLRSLTSLSRRDFEALAEVFSRRWQHYQEHFTLEGSVRERKHKGRRNAVFASDHEMLLFVLYHYKLYPIQQALATTFGLWQSTVCFYLGLCERLLVEALDELDALPERDGTRLQQVVASEVRLLIDATERRVQRSGDATVQREHYSGKKKRTRLRISSSRPLGGASST